MFIFSRTHFRTGLIGVAIALTSPSLNPSLSLAAPNPISTVPHQPPVSKIQVSKIQVSKIQVSKIQVSKIQVTGSTLIPADEIAAIVAPYENRSLTLAELTPVTEQLTQYYLDRGYLTSRAVLVDQTLDPTLETGNTIQIRVIEGQLEAIDVQGTHRVQPRYIRDRIARADRIPLRSTDIENQLRLLKLDPLFSQVEASLKEGNSLGKSILQVRVTEAPTWSGKFTIDNDINPIIGSEKFELSGGTQNLTGHGDRLWASYARSFSGGANFWTIQYQLPLNPMQGSLTAQLSPNRYQITDGEFRDLNIIGSSQTYDLTVRQPLIRSPRQEFALSLGLNTRNGETVISNFLANRSRTTTLSFGQDYLRRDRQGFWSARSMLTLGVPWFGATSNLGPNPQFLLWSGHLQRLHVLSPGQTLLAQLNAQLSPDPLPAANQFSLGGVNRLRGYRPGIQSGDSGLTTSIENQITIDRNALGLPTVQLVPFFDLGALWNSSSSVSPPLTPNLFAGTGLSFRWKPGPHMTIQLDAALPLVQPQPRGNALQDAALYFSTQYHF